jgi:transcriptional regulator with XRE-family HTH domain
MRVQGEIVFPNNIRELRHRKQLTQLQLGRLLEPPLSESTISKMESGERRLTNLQLANLASVLECRPDDIPVVAGRDSPSGVRHWEQAQHEAARRSVESGAAATGYVLAQLRKKHGKTMQQVADELGVALSVYHRVEMASRIIQQDEIEAAAKLYGLSGDQLIAMFERQTRENRRQLESGTPPEKLLPRTPRSLLKEDRKWGRLGALERYAIRRSIRYAPARPAATGLPVYGAVQTDEHGSRRFAIDRSAPVDEIAIEELLQPRDGSFLVRNFSQRLPFLLRPGSLAYIDPAIPVATGDLAFVVRHDDSAEVALVLGDGVGPLKLKMYNPEEEVFSDDPTIAELLRVTVLLLR